MARNILKFSLNQMVNSRHLLARQVPNASRNLSYAINGGLLDRKETVCRLTSTRLFESRQLLQKRFKSGADSDDEGTTDALESIPAGQSVKTNVNVKSLKIEFILPKSLFKTRAQLEDAISKGRLRLNGEEVKSKNTEVEELDTFDYILGRNKQDYDMLDVNRVIIVTLPDKMIKGRFDVEIEKWKNLTIENYLDPWTGKTTNE